MLTSIALVYVAVSLIPTLSTQLGLTKDGSQASSVTSVPSDGPDTVYQAAHPPQPFFPASSFVFDSYRGELAYAAQAMEEYGYVFVMYYASWSTRCMLARDEFAEAARIMYPRVPFVAINCWHPNSQCKNKYKFYSYPSFYVYASGMELGFTYTGIEKANYLVRFIQSLLNPITHISNSSQLISFVSSQESSLVGYFNLSSHEPEARFQQFYYASLRSIEADFIQPVRFGLLSDDKFASEFEMNDVKPLLLVRSISDNLPYPSNSNFTSSAINKWVNKNKLQPTVKWKFPNGRKSTALYRTLQSGPTVLLLTEYDACSQHNAHVNLLREVVLDYYTCNTTEYQLKQKINQMILGSIKNRQSGNPYDNPLCIMCHNKQQWSELDERDMDQCCYTVADHNSVCQACLNQIPCSGTCKGCNRINPTRLTALASDKLSCYSYKSSYLFSSQLNQVCCKTHSSSRFFTDGFVYDHRGCAPLPVTNNHPEECIANIRLPDNSTVCNKNSTPNFIAVDRKLYNELSIRLSSLRHLNQTLYPQLILIDLQQEAHHILRDSYNKRNIVEFLEQYSSGRLSRDHMVSHPKPNGNNNLIMDVNSRQLVTYIETLHRPDLLVYFYSKWCLHCKAVHHKFISLSRYLSRLTSIKFLRFDVSAETLPWKYSVSQVPTFTMFIQRGHTHQLTPFNDVGDILKEVIQYTSANHLIETVLSRHTPPVQHIIPKLRSKITQLQIHLETYTHGEWSGTQYDQIYESLHPIIHHNVRSLKLQLLNLRKIYRCIYYNLDLRYHLTRFKARLNLIKPSY